MSATAGSLAAARVARQFLADVRAESLSAVVERVVGVQAQAVRPSRLAFRPRTQSLTGADVDAATRSATVVRTWLMRSTLHLVNVDDLDWLLVVYGDVNIQAGGRRRRQLGLDEHVLEAAVAALPDVIDEPLSRAELIARLRQTGVDVSATGQAPAHLMVYAASTGLICRGPELERDEPSYVLTEQWLGRPVDLGGDRTAALATLARRYLAGYGPAAVDDFAYWSGLAKKEARGAVRSLRATGDVETVAGADGELLMLCPHRDPAGDFGRADDGTVRLLGAFDTLLLGFRSRDVLVAEEHSSKVRAGGGMIAATALDGDRIVGTWSVDRSRREPTVVLEPFTSIPRGRMAAWEDEVADLGRFLDEPLRLTVAS